MKTDFFNISEVSRMTNVSCSTIRRLDKLLRPYRAMTSGRRVYNEKHVKKILVLRFGGGTEIKVAGKAE